METLKPHAAATLLPTCSPTASSPPRREVVEFFLARATAEAMIREAREDEPVLTEDLRVEAIELPYLQQHVPRS